MKIIELPERATRLILETQAQISHLQDIVWAYVRASANEDLGQGQWKLSKDCKTVIYLEPEELGPRAVQNIEPKTDDGAA